MEQLISILSSFHLTSIKYDVKGVAFEHFIHSYTKGPKMIWVNILLLDILLGL